MANRVATPNLFNTTAPNWSLALLDANAQNAAGAINDSSLGAANGPLNDTGAANAYSVLCSYGTPSAYNNGMVVFFNPANTNTGASTLTVSPLSSLPIVSATGVALTGGELVAGTTVGVVCTGSAFRIFTTTSAKGFAAKTALYTVVASDLGTYFICSGGSWTLTLPSPSSGFWIRVRNDMGISGTTGTVTISPPSGQIDGAGSLALLAGQEAYILSDGTNWRTFGKQRDVIIGTLDITSSTASGQVLLPAGYRAFEILFSNFIPVTDRDNLRANFSADGGSTWKTTNYYEGIIYDNAATTTAYLANNATAYVTLSATGNTPGPYTAMSHMRLIPGSATLNPTYIINSAGYDSFSARLRQYVVGGIQIDKALVNAMKFNASTGNISNLSVTVKGISA